VGYVRCRAVGATSPYYGGIHARVSNSRLWPSASLK
jgi:hypothetical protein